MTYRTYLRNIIEALQGKPPRIEVLWRTKHHDREVIKEIPYPVEVPVYTKDPQGLIKRDLAIIKKYSSHKPYKLGDSPELVAYKAGQADLIKLIEDKLVAPKTRQLQEP